MTAPHKIGEIRNYMIQEKIDILFVQETKIIHGKGEADIRSSTLTDGTKFIHGTARLGKENRGSTGGIAVHNITEYQFLFHRILYIKIAQQVNNNTTHLHLYGVYAPTADQEHQQESVEFYRILSN